MAYVKCLVKMKNCIEVYKYFNGRIGKKIVNGTPEGTTPISQLKYQDKKAERIIRWKLNENFTTGDMLVTLTYPQIVDIETARKNIDLFLKNLRRYYKRSGLHLKYIYVAGVTKRGTIHFHIVLNKFSAEKIAELWNRITGGTANIKYLYSKTFKKLAAYLIKNSRETFYSDHKIHGKRFCASLNLKMPKITKHIVNASIWREDVKPIKGYILDKASIYNGYGWSDNGGAFLCCKVQSYTLFKIDDETGKYYGKNNAIPEIPIADDMEN